MSSSPSTNLTLKAPIYFLSRSPKYTTIKPYTLRYRPENGFPQTNVERTIHEVEICDMRQYPELRYEECGFKVVKMEGSEMRGNEMEVGDVMRYEDYDNLQKVEGVHRREVRNCVREALGARECVVCDYVVFCSSRSRSRFCLDFGYGGR
jgi:predicted DNA-binding protein (UPF0251 family)